MVIAVMARGANSGALRAVRQGAAFARDDSARSWSQKRDSLRRVTVTKRRQRY